MNSSRLSRRTCWICCLSLALCNSPASSQDIYDTQKESIPRQDPKQVVAEARLPEGFRMQAAASEPDVQQPIAMAWDDRGRLWIAENYTYSEASKKFDMQLSDRIVVLEDTNGDGTFDKRKVFHEGLKELTSIEVDKNGVWALASPSLYFIPDADHDDVPDRAPHTILTGFNTEIRHNFANGLRFGPDGWLYGRHGILGTSNISLQEGVFLNRTDQFQNLGAPPRNLANRSLGSAASATTGDTNGNVKLTCGVWRYSPQLHEVEMVCEGTTNPWGMDWDAHGNLFFINTVIGHLWHAIPNAHLQRMYGEDSDPYAYELLPQIADHVHWDEKGEDWRATRLGAPSSGTDAAGGGHAHSGLMIYQADQWPESYRNKLFTLNLHGLRINSDRIERLGAGFVGKHETDMVFWKDPWFRGLDLSTAPDGSVYVIDWSDIGECHDDDGIHRHSGRIYRIAYEGKELAKNEAMKGVETKLLKVGMGGLSSSERANLLLSPNAWYVNQLLKYLQANRGGLDSNQALIEQALNPTKSTTTGIDPVVLQLRTIWALNATGQLTDKHLFQLLRTKQHEAVHVWAVRLFADRAPFMSDGKKSEGESEILDRLSADGIDKSSPLLRLYVASLLPRFSEHVWQIASQLAKSSDLVNDRYFSHVFWFGLKEHAAQDPMFAAKLAVNSKLPKLAEWIVRRIVVDDKTATEAVSWVIGEAARTKRPELQTSIVNAMWGAYQGRRSATPPNNWERLSEQLIQHPDNDTREKALMLQAVFGDGIAVDQLVTMANSSDTSLPARRSAIESLGVIGSEKARGVLWNLVTDQHVGEAAASALGRSLNAEDAKRLIELYAKAWPPAKAGIVRALGGKRESLSLLLDAIEKQSILSNDIDASTWRQFTLVADWELLSRARKLNPTLGVAEDKAKAIDAMENWLTDERLSKADAGRGRAVWVKTCSQCHKLFSEGGPVGPELTGGQRSNKRYWLENILAPSAIVATNYQLEVFLTIDGGIISGVPISETEKEITIQMAKDRTVLDKSDISERRKSTLSLMPEGLLDTLSEEQRANLFKYLMSPGQVPINNQ